MINDVQRTESPEQQDFRLYCRDWLSAHHPGRPPQKLPLTSFEVSDPSALKWLQKWQKAAYEAGLVGCDYPTEVGGGGLTGCQGIANSEMFAAKTPYLPNSIGLGMAAPTVYFHARDYVKAGLLPKLFSGEEIWCQGFSEPGAGSDLANLQTFAKREGDSWVINGHKVWTTLAHFSSYMILLARTDKADKYGGLSYFIVPIKSAIGSGVTVRPLIKMNGETGFNEVLFEDLVIPDEFLLDKAGNGWKVAMHTTLTHERGAGEMITPSAGGMSNDEESSVSTTSIDSLIRLAQRCVRNGKAAADDSLIRDELVKLLIRSNSIKQNIRRASVPGLTDDSQRIPLQGKLVNTEFNQDLARLAYQIEGIASTLSNADPMAPDGGDWPNAYMNSFGLTIAAGANEVQRNILGERVLGLPKSK